MNRTSYHRLEKLSNVFCRLHLQRF